MTYEIHISTSDKCFAQFMKDFLEDSEEALKGYSIARIEEKGVRWIKIMGV